MDVTLSPRMQKFVEDKVKAGEYASADEVIEAGLASLARHGADGFAPGELDELLAEGERDIERGDLVDGEEVFRELEDLSAARRRGKTA
jgi:antitoxin ParD1/3/4